MADRLRAWIKACPPLGPPLGPLKRLSKAQELMLEVAQDEPGTKLFAVGYRVVTVETLGHDRLALMLCVLGLHLADSARVEVVGRALALTKGPPVQHVDAVLDDCFHVSRVCISDVEAKDQPPRLRPADDDTMVWITDDEANRNAVMGVMRKPRQRPVGAPPLCLVVNAQHQVVAFKYASCKDDIDRHHGRLQRSLPQ